jgi:alpha-amylase
MTPKVLLQAYYKRGKYIAVPCPADHNDDPGVAWWWDHLAQQAEAIARDGFTGLWLPPVTKAAQGMSAAALGYSVFDDYDVGSKNQKATVHTRYGNREQLSRCAALLRANGLEVYLDLQLNHRRGGTGADGMTFEYADAYGNKSGGRFPKHPTCFHSRYPAGHVPHDFHPEIPQDPNVPADLWELQENSNIYFGPDLAHVNSKPPRYVADNVIANVEWLTRGLDVQGYRLDHVQGISSDFLCELLDRELLRDLFAVGEYWNGEVARIHDWISSPRWMNGRCSAFDFPLYFRLLDMSNNPGFDMATLDHAGLTGVDPFHAVTFVENHDTESRRDLIPRNIQPEDKPLAYAYILTSEGYPCVFYKDWSRDPGCLGDRLQAVIRNLVWIHQNIAEGATQQRWKDRGVYVFERTGGARLLVAMNRDKSAARTIRDIATGFAPNVQLHDYTGQMGDVWTDAAGRLTITIPANKGGTGYVCFSVPGIDQRYTPSPSGVTQVFEGAADLDIKPAQSHAPSRVCRIYTMAQSNVFASLVFDERGWAQNTAITLVLQDASGAAIATKTYAAGSSGTTLTSTMQAEGWYSFFVRAQSAPLVDARLPFKLTVSYQGPNRMSNGG